MNDIRKIDLHMHTTVSDGTDTPEEILAHARETGLVCFSVTDHDAVKGCCIIRSLLKGSDPRFITGVEFSCKDEEGKYHILGYGFDPEAPSVHVLVEKGHGQRMNKLRRRLELLEQDFGIALPEEAVASLYALDNPGKPHIGNLMVRYGFAPTKEEAIDRFIDKVRFRSEFIRPEEAIGAILAAGGIPVLAHPAFGSGSQRIVGEDMDRRLKRLTGFGLRGMEAYYSGFTDELRDEMLAFADRYGLYVTAGSDYHGTNKRVALGDTGLARAPKVAEGLMRFLREVPNPALS